MNRERVLEAVYRKASELLKDESPVAGSSNCHAAAQIVASGEHRSVVICLIQAERSFKAFKSTVSDDMSVSVTSQSPFCDENDALTYWGNYLFEEVDKVKLSVE